MPLMICPKCNKFHYVPGECPAAEVRTVFKTGTVRRLDGKPVSKTVERDVLEGHDAAIERAMTRTPPVDLTEATLEAAIIATARVGAIAIIPKRGRPRIHPDRKAYKAQKERERRAKAKLAH